MQALLDVKVDHDGKTEVVHIPGALMAEVGVTLVGRDEVVDDHYVVVEVLGRHGDEATVIVPGRPVCCGSRYRVPTRCLIAA